MTTFAYTYKKISDLDLDSKLQNFYGKIVFILKNDNDEKQTILLLKDATASVYLHVTSKEGQRLDFKLRQVLRVHRCRVEMRDGLKTAIAEIGKSGCHLIVWSQLGDVKEPVIISSRTWTRSKQDSEEITALSDLDKKKPTTTSEEIVEKLHYFRAQWRILKRKKSHPGKDTSVDRYAVLKNVVDDFFEELTSYEDLKVKQISYSELNRQHIPHDELSEKQNKYEVDHNEQDFEQMEKDLERMEKGLDQNKQILELSEETLHEEYSVQNE
ncbi:unnamed protein product [Caenorhabditis brenneri]